MLKVSTKNKRPPNIADAKGAKHSVASLAKPQKAQLINDAKGKSSKGTFTAPRKGDDMNPAACGYMKMKG